MLYELFDDCDGHPSPRGDYHYHKFPRQLSVFARVYTTITIFDYRTIKQLHVL